MPYFFILPLYIILVCGLLALSVLLLWIKPLRAWSSYVAVGTAGTFPGFVIGNLLFWVAVFALAALLHKPIAGITSEVFQAASAITLAILFMVGLAIANVTGCLAGFGGGLWLWAKFKRRSQPAEPDLMRRKSPAWWSQRRSK